MLNIDLHTPRLHIRQFEPGDLEDCHRFRRQIFSAETSIERVRGWLDWTIASYRELADLFQPPYSDYAINLKENGAFIGSVGVVPTLIPWGSLEGGAPGLLSPEVGLFWGIMPIYRRRGCASEAAAALIDCLFRELKLCRLVATTKYDNVASQKTMTKIGMTLHRNASAAPAWCQVVGRLENPALS